MPRLPSPPYRLDLWTTVRAAGGSRVAFLVDAGGRVARNVQRTRFLEAGRSALTFDVHPDFHAIAELAPENAVVCLTRFVPTGPDSFEESIEEWIVVQRERDEQRTSGWYQVRCVPVEDLLLDLDLYREVSAGGLSVWRYGATERTPGDVLEDLAARLTALGYSWIDVGTVTPTTPVTFELVGTATPRAIITALVEALAAQGVDAEFQFTLADDLSEYRLELVTRVAGSLAALQAHVGVNAPQVRYTEDASEQASVIVPFTPDGVDLRELQFAASAVDGATGWITIEGIGGIAAPLVACDDQYNGMYLHRERTGKNFLITDTSLSPRRIRVAVGDLASGIAAGERFSLRATEDLAGTRRAFGTPGAWSPFEVVSTLSGPPRINCDDLFDSSGVVDADDQWVDWLALRSFLVAALPSGDFDPITGILDLGSAPSLAPQAGDWVWFGTEDTPPGTVQSYNAGTFEITVVPRYAGTQYSVVKTGLTSARCYRPTLTPMWIVASLAASSQLEVDASTSSPNDVLEVYQPCQGARLVELADPAAVAATRRKVGTLTIECTGATNRLENADMAEWAGADTDPPDDWSIENEVGTVTTDRVTDPTYTRHGGQSWRIDFAAGASAELFAPLIPIHPVPGMDQVAAGLALLFTRFTGNVGLSVTLYQVAADGTRTAIENPLLIYPADTTRNIGDASKAALETWFDAQLNAMPVRDVVDEQLQLGIARAAGTGNAPCTFYIDAAILLQRVSLPQDVEGGVKYVFGSDALPMLAAANVALQDRALPLVSFTGRMIDVFRLDGTRYAPFELVLGRDVTLRFPALALTRTVRLLGLSELLDEPASPQVTLDRVRPDVGRLMAARLVPRAPARVPPQVTSSGGTSTTETPTPPPAPEPAISGLTVTKVNGTDFEVAWDHEHMPDGVVFRIVWAITADGSGSGTQEAAVSPQTIVASSLGSAPHGSVEVQARTSGGSPITSQLHTGAFLL